MSEARILWLGGVFDETTINQFLSTSPATNFWQRGLIAALLNLGLRVDIVGFAIERAWPYGKFLVRAKDCTLPVGFHGSVVPYVNVPLLRRLYQLLNQWRLTKAYLCQGSLPDVVINFSCLSHVDELDPCAENAKRIRRKFAIPWICIVGDGVAPPGADGYIYLTWEYFDLAKSPGPKLFLDGGVPSVRKLELPSVERVERRFVFMFMGALTSHAGVTWLATAFENLKDDHAELWITGRGANEELVALASRNPKIKLLGFLSEEELDRYAAKADVFVNPRPGGFEANKLNYPSKLLHYFSYEKPVISTLTPGLSPEYKDLIIPIDETIGNGLEIAMQKAMSLGRDEIEIASNKIKHFNLLHSWDAQARRLTLWLERLEILSSKEC